MDNIELEQEKLNTSFQEVKNKVNYKGWGLIIILLLIGITIGYFLRGGC